MTMSLRAKRLQEYWEIAFQWNAPKGMIVGGYTVGLAIITLRKICQDAPYNSLLYKKACRLLDDIIVGADGPQEQQIP